MTGFGLARVEPYSWLVDRGTVGTDTHLAFTVDTHEEVHVCCDAALATGATVREAPAVRPEYHADCYDGTWTARTDRPRSRVPPPGAPPPTRGPGHGRVRQTCAVACITRCADG